MDRTFINLAKEPSRGIDALQGTRVPAVFSDAVRVQLKECALLFISGKVGLKDDNTLAGRTMREQTRQTLRSGSAPVGRAARRSSSIWRSSVSAVQSSGACSRSIA